MSNWYINPSNDDILHYGILGMKWGVRRYQNKDGSLTAKGLKRYGTPDDRTMLQLKNRIHDAKTKEDAMNVLREGDKQKNLELLKKVKTHEKLYAGSRQLTNTIAGSLNVALGASIGSVNNIVLGALSLGLGQIMPFASLVSDAKLKELVKTLETEISEENKNN